MTDVRALRALLLDGTAALGLALDDAACSRLLEYVALMQRWNAAYNLTAIRDASEIVTKHLLDSLAVLSHLDPHPLADLGSGAGLPGIPLAIAQPGRDIVLVESNGKKARFLRECVRALPLPNASVAETRAEAGAVGATRSAIARALATLDVLCGYAEPWVGPAGRLYAMKGPGFEPELAALRPGWVHEGTRALFVPGLDAGRVLVVLKRSAGEPRA